MSSENQKYIDRTMFYGKKEVYVYRTYAKPLKVDSIPESDFTGRDNTLFGVEVQVALHGDFLHNYVDGDNTGLVATDSMKNFIEYKAGEFEFATIDGFLHGVAIRFLDKYPQIQQIDLSAQEKPFHPVQVAKEDEDDIEESGIVFRPANTERARSNISMKRNGSDYEIIDYSSGMQDLHLVKITGNSFYGFVDDEYKKLPEEYDRNLFIYLDIDWNYYDDNNALAANTDKYVPAEQVRDIAAAVFHKLKNNSIQHLVYHIGLQVLERFPQLKDISFFTNNRTWPKVVDEIEGSEGKVYHEPELPYGYQAFTVTQEDVEAKENRAEEGRVKK